MKLLSHETVLVGGSVFDGQNVDRDEVAKRIQWLTQNYLVEVAVGNWCMLYRDPGDGRLWEETFPHSYLQGGGPATLSVISRDQAIKTYGKTLPM